MQSFQIAFSSILIFANVFADDSEISSCEYKFCEEDPNYPEKILNSLELWRYNFESSDDRKAKRSLDFDSNSFIVERKLCESKISFIRPQKIENVNNQLRTIVIRESPQLHTDSEI